MGSRRRGGRCTSMSYTEFVSICSSRKCDDDEENAAVAQMTADFLEFIRDNVVSEAHEEEDDDKDTVPMSCEWVRLRVVGAMDLLSFDKAYNDARNGLRPDSTDDYILFYSILLDAVRSYHFDMSLLGFAVEDGEDGEDEDGEESGEESDGDAEEGEEGDAEEEEKQDAEEAEAGGRVVSGRGRKARRRVRKDAKKDAAAGSSE